MKILYVSNAQEITGWGDSAYLKILGMKENGLDVVCKNIDFGGPKRNCPILNELQEKPHKDYDVVIQHTLPHLYSRMSEAKHIGAYETEGSFKKSLWQKYINMMDESWVPSRSSERDALCSDVKNKISIIPHAINIDLYKNVQETATIDGLKNGFNFCFVGELVKRKNVRALLTAFHLEFHPSENVNLFLKLHRSGCSGAQCLEMYNMLNYEIVNGLKIKGRSNKIYTLCEYQTKEHLISLMAQCHCFVNPSFGESWTIPALEAMALGLNVVYNKNIGTADFANHPHCYPVISSPVNCFGAVDSLPQLYNGHDYWYSIDIDALRSAMRDAYTNRNNIDRESIKKHAEQYDYRKIGELICNNIK